MPKKSKSELISREDAEDKAYQKRLNDFVVSDTQHKELVGEILDDPIESTFKIITPQKK